MIPVAVLGAKGRLGSSICTALEKNSEFELVARVGSKDPLSAITDSGAERAIDVTNCEAASINLKWLSEHGIDTVVGTTGFDRTDLADLKGSFEGSGTRCFFVPNFSIGAVLLMRLAEAATPHFDNVEIIELHHNRKKDAPSGTARHTAERIASVRTTPWAPDPTELETATGARGGEVSDIRVHSVRMPGLLASEEVIFGTTGQTLTLRHDTFDNSAFIPGVLLALRSIERLAPGLTTGLDAVL